MRTTITTATFLLVGAGAAGVSAVEFDLRGSDTLKELTLDIVHDNAIDCGGLGNAPAGVIEYVGTGSGNGQSAMTGTPPFQDIAPMSRAMTGATGPASGACSTPSPSKAEGIVFALDGLAIVGNTNTAGFGANVACNGNPANNDCDPTNTDPNTGVAINTTLAHGYVLGAGGLGSANAWKDALRLIFAGMDQNGGSTLANRDCNSQARHDLVDNWAALFQGACPAGTCGTYNATGGQASSGTGGLRHAFRRNDESGTTDVFVALLGLPSTSQPGNQSAFCNEVVGTLGTNPELSSNCGAAAGVCAAPGTACTLNTPTAGSPSTGICTQLGNTSSPGPTCACVRLPAPIGPTNKVFPAADPPHTTANTINIGPNFADMQDRDVIRRYCPSTGAVASGSENVCSARGDMGLVLPIWDATDSDINNPFPSDPVADRCATGKFNFMDAAKVTNSKFDICPDGHQDTLGNCAFPVKADGLSPDCWNASSNTFTGDFMGNYDARVYTLHQHFLVTPAASPPVYHYVTEPRGTGTTTTPTIQANMVGGYYRIHTAHSLSTPDLQCHQGSATDQIGCLVQASPCSWGYAGREASNIVVSGGAGTTALKVNAVDPTDQCVRNLIEAPTVGSLYPISRKLYLNSMIGFEAVSAIATNGPDEAKLAGCFAHENDVNPALFTSIESKVTAHHFITIGPAAQGGAAFCEDFDEKVNCGAASNVDACSNNGSAPSAGNTTRIPIARHGTCALSNPDSASSACLTPGDGGVGPFEGEACTGPSGAGGHCVNSANAGAPGCLCQ